MLVFTQWCDCVLHAGGKRHLKFGLRSDNIARGANFTWIFNKEILD